MQIAARVVLSRLTLPNIGVDGIPVDRPADLIGHDD